jgi:hypothetical protein
VFFLHLFLSASLLRLRVGIAYEVNAWLLLQVADISTMFHKIELET